MKLLIQFGFLFFATCIFTATLASDDRSEINNLSVVSVYQIEDDVRAGFDFFTSRNTHKCGGKLSNRYRSYSDHKEVANRKFQLILSALNNQHKVSLKSVGCEGRSLLVDYVGISR